MKHRRILATVTATALVSSGLFLGSTAYAATLEYDAEAQECTLTLTDEERAEPVAAQTAFADAHLAALKKAVPAAAEELDQLRASTNDDNVDDLLDAVAGKGVEAGFTGDEIREAVETFLGESRILETIDVPEKIVFSVADAEEAAAEAPWGIGYQDAPEGSTEAYTEFRRSLKDVSLAHQQKSSDRNEEYKKVAAICAEGESGEYSLLPGDGGTTPEKPEKPQKPQKPWKRLSSFFGSSR